MRVLLQADMDGAAMIADHRELVTWWPEYWRVGRAKMNTEVAAAAQGLLDGGASAVTVFDGHGSGAQNLDPALMPSGVSVIPLSDIERLRRLIGESAFDAVFQVGRHPRTGTNDGFIPHTQVLGLALAVDGMPITECHLLAWSAGVPVLGIAGDARLEPQLDGALAGTPFLPVKQSRGRGATTPIYPDVASAAEAVREFARRCILAGTDRPAPRLPARFTFAACILDPAVAERADGQGGLKRQSARVLSAVCEDWNRDAVPAMYAAMRVIGDAQSARIGPLAVRTEADLGHAGEGLERGRALFEEWLAIEEPAWLE